MKYHFYTKESLLKTINIRFGCSRFNGLGSCYWFEWPWSKNEDSSFIKWYNKQ